MIAEDRPEAQPAQGATSLFRQLWQQAQGRLGVEAAWVAVGMLVAYGGQALILRIITTYLPRTSFGLFVLANSASAFGISVLFGPVVQAMMRSAPDAIRDGAVRALIHRTGHIMGRVLWLGVGGVAIAATVLAFRGQGHAVPLLVATMAMTYGDYRFFRTMTVEHVARMRKRLAIHRACDTAARAGMIFTLLHVAPNAAFVPIAHAIGGLTVNTFFERRLLKDFPDKHGTSRVEPAMESRALLIFSLPLGGSLVLSWLHTNADRWLLERMRSLGDAALYGAGAQLSLIPTALIGGLLLGFAEPIIFGRAARSAADARKWIHRLALVYLSLSILGWFALVLLSGFFVHLLLGPSVWECRSIVPMIAAGWSVFRFGEVYQMGLTATRQTVRVVTPNLLGAIAALVANLILIPPLGAAGAAWAFFISGTVRTLAMATTYYLVRVPAVA